jgi:hypothetical protein
MRQPSRRRRTREPRRLAIAAAGACLRRIEAPSGKTPISPTRHPHTRDGGYGRGFPSGDRACPNPLMNQLSSLAASCSRMRIASRATRTKAAKAAVTRELAIPRRSRRSCPCTQARRSWLRRCCTMCSRIRASRVGRSRRSSGRALPRSSPPSEDPSIDEYATRKRHLRRQVANAGPDAALIFLADKLANVEALAASGSPIEPAKLEHYRATLMLLSTAYPEIEVAAQLSHALRSIPRH